MWNVRQNQALELQNVKCSSKYHLEVIHVGAPHLGPPVGNARERSEYIVEMGESVIGAQTHHKI